MIVLHTNHGKIALELDAERAPKTVANFLDYVRAGHFDNTLFHRVIDGFMIQGGGMSAGFRQKPTRAPIENEARNGLKNERYTRRHGAHRRSALGDRAVLHQRRRQRFSQLIARPTPTAGATACSAASAPGSRRRRPDQGVADGQSRVRTRTCLQRM